MYLSYVFFLYVLWLSFERMFNWQCVTVLYRMAYAKIVDSIKTIFWKVSSKDNLIRADTFTGKRNYANARGTLRRWAGTITRLCGLTWKIKDTSRAMFVHPYCIKRGEKLKVVNRSAGFY